MNKTKCWMYLYSVIDLIRMVSRLICHMTLPTSLSFGWIVQCDGHIGSMRLCQPIETLIRHLWGTIRGTQLANIGFEIPGPSAVTWQYVSYWISAGDKERERERVVHWIMTYIANIGKFLRLLDYLILIYYMASRIVWTYPELEIIHILLHCVSNTTTLSTLNWSYV